MKKSTFTYFVWLMALCLSAGQALAQQGIGTNKPNKASVLDLTSNSKGLLFPRVALKNTTNFNPITGINLSESHAANSLIIYNTATSGSGETAVKPGYYYWEKPTSTIIGKWKRLINETDLNEFLLKGDVTGLVGQTRVEKIQNIPVAITTPTIGQVMQFNGSNWNPTTLPQAAVTGVQNGLTLNNSTVELGGTLNKSTIINQNSNSLTIATGGSNLVLSGINKTTVQNNADYLLSIGNGDIVKAVKASMPKFFYMPSMYLPLAQDQIVSAMHTTYNNTIFTVNLYSVYAEQFGGSNTANSTSNTSKTTTLPVLNKQELDYYITFYDNTVYTNVTVNNDGILTYKIAPQADPNSGSFMNIVFAVKP